LVVADVRRRTIGGVPIRLVTSAVTLFSNAKLAEDGVEQIFRRGFAAPAIQELSQIKRSSVEKRRRAAARTLREIQSSPELAERLDCGDFSTAFVRTGNIHHSGLSARPTAPLKPAHSKRWREIPASHDAREAFWTAPALWRFAMKITDAKA
jgi:hypothetical protein